MKFAAVLKKKKKRVVALTEKILFFVQDRKDDDLRANGITKNPKIEGKQLKECVTRIWYEFFNYGYFRARC